MKQTLYLLRHAKAEPWSPGCDDFSRQLSSKGRDHMEHLSRWFLANLALPDLVLCSTSARTRGTLQPFLEECPDLESRTRYLDDIYEATTGRLHGLAEKAFERFNTVLMVGHNPGFESLVFSLLEDEYGRRVDKMATGTLGALDFEAGYETDAGQGTLRQWITRKSLVD